MAGVTAKSYHIAVKPEGAKTGYPCVIDEKRVMIMARRRRNHRRRAFDAGALATP